ncbi:hypothetical protein [Legionella jordanis]|uniref:Uncharacterized protein n=1 Tax=Legionella jordanis TaxID=456 RepID=A0A0W0VEJ4_9GAMM|nr:hypothetical protein [Legionella jordanis]KTD18230.1 hypothetical protein Ljor_2536 [Legionella jordanis]RMX01188.1 hypothetical protein EAW55_11460 [Legionella jordanis]RMX21418.1 hypothetical protein EAS68_04425 [Legionella jordanis]VEH13677.1 Uncharacterised protein [Legionella jordanis]
MSLEKLIEEISKYANSKGTSAHDEQKKNFFSLILDSYHEKTLTVANLTFFLMQLDPEDHRNLFWLSRSRSASPNSQAAQLIAKLYRELGVPITDQYLAHLVAANSGQKDAIGKVLSTFPYRYWQRDPWSKLARKNLDRELKVSLGLHTFADKSLVEALDEKPADLQNNLLKLFQNTPAYFPEVVKQLYDIQKNKEKNSELGVLVALGEDSPVEDLEKELLALVQEKPELFNAVCDSDPEIATAVIQGLIKENPVHAKYFFDLPQALQERVQTLLQERFDFTSLGAISELTTSIHFVLQKPEGVEPLTHMVTVLAKSLEAEQTHLIADFQKKQAIEIIDAYLAQEPGSYKSNFFNQLKKRIESDGLTVDVLLAELQGKDKGQLFAKWSGASQSRAMKVLFDLYKMANFVSPAEEKLYRQSIHFDPVNDVLAKRHNIDAKRQEYIQRKVRQALRAETRSASELANKSELEKRIVPIVNDYKTYSPFVYRSHAFMQRQVEARYQALLIEKAFEKVGDGRDALFDPQGHIIVVVDADDFEQEDYDLIFQGIPGLEANKHTLEKMLGRSINAKTLCNLDIADSEGLKQKFKERLHAPELDEALDQYLASDERSSVVALQEEMMMHISLSLRGLEKMHGAPLLTEEQRWAVMREVNNGVLVKFANILKQVKDEEDEIDFVRLNKELDEARKDLAPGFRELLVDAIKKAKPDDFESLTAKMAAELNKEHFTETTATGWDYLRTDNANQSVTHISATEKTAHGKQLGAEEQAVRVVSRNQYIANGHQVRAYQDATAELRVPSIAQNSGPHSDAVRDVKEKLARDVRQLRAKNGYYSGPIIYNLLTSLHSKAYDNLPILELQNKQRASAARILKGSHWFNYEQLLTGETQAFVYVQNIPVNQHTNELNYYASDNATSEAALMADMAMLATFERQAAHFPPQLRESICTTFRAAHAKYIKFLPQAEYGNKYFKDSQQGNETIKDFTAKKEKWKSALPMTPADNLPALAVQALFSIMVNDHHHNKQFGMLTQALSVYVEEMSMAGCKSANERYQAVSSRAGLLKSIAQNEGPFSHEKQAVLDTLKLFVSGKASIEQLQEKLDIAYNKHNLHGAVAAISEEDQGASSKVQATSNKENKGVVSEWNTNYAESGYLSRLFQKFSSKLQAHKAQLTEKFIELFKARTAEASPEEPKMSSIPLVH